MRVSFSDKKMNSEFVFAKGENELHREFGEEIDGLSSIIWNRGEDQKVIVDGMEFLFKKNQFLTLMSNNCFEFEHSENMTLWQFNKTFYCIVDHDIEVSCSGFLFSGWTGMMFLDLDDEMIRKFDLLTEVFIDEFTNHDSIQGEMLRMLLKRLIILLTRIGKKQYLKDDSKPDEYNLIREYNSLVEKNFKKMHQVRDYAELLYKSPKTLSNLFSKLSEKTPLQIIRERLVLEAKRLLKFTDQPISEIAYELGFDENAHFSRFFKQLSGVSPKKFREI